MTMITLNCPHCKDPISAHDDGGCCIESSAGSCPCGMPATVVLIEIIKDLAKAAQDTCALLEIRLTQRDRLAYEKLTKALNGIEFVEEEPA